MKKNKIKNTGVEVTELSFGTSSLGSMPDTYGYEVPEQRAQETLKRFFQSPVNMLDTSRNYAMGESEKRIGKAIKKMEAGQRILFYQQKLIEIWILLFLIKKEPGNLLKKV